MCWWTRGLHDSWLFNLRPPKMLGDHTPTVPASTPRGRPRRTNAHYDLGSWTPKQDSPGSFLVWVSFPLSRIILVSGHILSGDLLQAIFLARGTKPKVSNKHAPDQVQFEPVEPGLALKKS